MNRPTPTNRDAWRFLDRVFLSLFVIGNIEALQSISTKGGPENWVNWSVLAMSVWGASHYWKNLFGKRNP